MNKSFLLIVALVLPGLAMGQTKKQDKSNTKVVVGTGVALTGGASSYALLKRKAVGEYGATRAIFAPSFLRRMTDADLAQIKQELAARNGRVTINVTSLENTKFKQVLGYKGRNGLVLRSGLPDNAIGKIVMKNPSAAEIEAIIRETDKIGILIIKDIVRVDDKITLKLIKRASPLEAISLGATFLGAGYAVVNYNSGSNKKSASHFESGRSVVEKSSKREVASKKSASSSSVQ